MPFKRRPYVRWVLKRLHPRWRCAVPITLPVCLPERSFPAPGCPADVLATSTLVDRCAHSIARHRLVQLDPRLLDADVDLVLRGTLSRCKHHALHRLIPSFPSSLFPPSHLPSSIPPSSHLPNSSQPSSVCSKGRVRWVLRPRSR